MAAGGGRWAVAVGGGGGRWPWAVAVGEGVLAIGEVERAAEIIGLSKQVTARTEPESCEYRDERGGEPDELEDSSEHDGAAVGAALVPGVVPHERCWLGTSGSRTCAGVVGEYERVPPDHQAPPETMTFKNWISPGLPTGHLT